MVSRKYLCATLVLALICCQMLVPVVECMHKHHNNNNEGLAVLLAAGLLAKLLRHKHEEHHIHIPVPVHHEEHHGHHEHHEHHGSARSAVQQPPPLPMQHLYGGAMMGAPSQPGVIIRRIIYTAPQPGYPAPVPQPGYAVPPPQPVYPAQNPNVMPY